MRNLQIYPITEKEVQEALQDLIRKEMEDTSPNYGRTTPFILKSLLAYFNESPENMKDLLNKMKK